ncbi:MAG: SIS domain-containing protein [Candidatus Omnitrophota bacterium]
MENFLRSYLEGINSGLDSVAIEKLKKVADILCEAYKKGNHIIVMGNGGSASTASHFACDIGKGLSLKGKKRFKIFALCDNVATTTAYANDCGYDNIFVEQLLNIVKESDVVIGISASGNSPNILNAIEAANKHSAITIGLTGFKGGRLRDLASLSIVVESNVMEQVEDIHLIILHMIKLFLKEQIENKY